MKLQAKVKVLASAIALAGFAYMPQASASATIVPVPGSISFTGTPAAGAFTDWFDFQVTGLATVIATGNSITFGGGTSGTQLTSFNLYDGNHTTLLATGTITPIPAGPGITFDAALLSYAPLAAYHTYSLEVDGTAYSQRGDYSWSLSAAPVPEPGTYAMMLAGLGMMGFMMRRRKMD